MSCVGRVCVCVIKYNVLQLEMHCLYNILLSVKEVSILSQNYIDTANCI